MKRTEVLLGVLVVLVLVLIGVEVQHYYIYEPKQMAKMKSLAGQVRSSEMSAAVDARLVDLMHFYEDGNGSLVNYDSIEGWVWWMGYTQHETAADQQRVFGSIEETFHRNKQLGGSWKRVHMAIDNKPSWQPTDQPFMAYTE